MCRIFCPNKETDIRDFLERKADHAFQGECAAQTRLSEAPAELDRREWKMQNADIVLYETGMQLQSQRMEKSWLCHELEMRNRAFQEDRARNCQEIEELRRICCTEAERARQLRSDELSTQKEEGKSTVSLWFRSR